MRKLTDNNVPGGFTGSGGADFPEFSTPDFLTNEVCEFPTNKCPEILENTISEIAQNQPLMFPGVQK